MSTKNNDTSLQDLLFNGAIACMLLFLIIGVNAAGRSLLINNNINNVNDYTSNYSLPLKANEVRGNMESVYFVEITPEPNDTSTLNLLTNSFERDNMLFEWKIGDDFTSNVSKNKNTFIYSVIFSTSNTAVFSFKPVLSSVFATDAKAFIKIRILEGLSFGEESKAWNNFKGTVESDISSPQMLRGLDLKIYRSSNPNRLFQINGYFVPVAL